MKNTIFIKENFITKLASSINTAEEAQNLFTEKMPEGILYNLVNRTDYLEETCQALNSNNKIVFISGFQGTGKTDFLNTIIAAREEYVLNFYYECSAITQLDNIILSLFNYLKKISIKNADYKRNFRISNSQSIDERLINSIKNLERPLLITIDGFENLLYDTESEEYKDLIHFLEFASCIPEIKIIIAGRRVDISSFKKRENFFEVRLGGLEEQKANQVLRANGLQETESGFSQIYQVTRGYPENLLWFCNAVNTLKVRPFELMQEYFAQESKSFEEFIYQKIYYSISENYHKIACFFSAIRHSVNIETLKKLDFEKDIEEKIEFLCGKMILSQSRTNFYIKSLLKQTIYLKISQEDKMKIHRYLYEIYSEQISKKLEERAFEVSRKLLYTEQYYHYMCLINMGEKALPDIKSSTLSNLKPDFKYLYTNVADNLFTGSEESSVQVVEEATPIHEQKSSEKVLYRNFYNISDFKIELTEEEKALLGEEDKFPDLEIKKEADSPKVISFQERKEEKNNNLSELEIKAENLLTEANSLYETRMFDSAIDKYKECLILFERLSDIKKAHQVLISLATACSECYKHDAALLYYFRIINSESEEITKSQKISALSGVADIYNYRNDFDTSLKFYERALQEADKATDIKQKSRVCFRKALVYDDLGDYDSALEFYIKNTGISENPEINPDISAAYANIAAIYEERGDLNKAREYYSRALKFDTVMNNKEGQYEILSHIGNIHFEQIDYPRANQCFHKALEIAKQINDSYKIAMSFLDIGDIHLQEKHYEQSLKAFIIAKKTIEKTISTDSKEKIDRRLKKVISEIGEQNFKQIVDKLKKKQ
jgi:tetratricopeptide (TPR) repeat protein